MKSSIQIHSAEGKRFCSGIQAKTEGSMSVRSLFVVFMILSASLFLLVYFAFLKNGRLLGIDDADIFFGYAENLCSGRGISFAMNGTRCEGTTSMLWLLLCSFCFMLRIDELGVFAVALVLLLASQWAWIRVLFQILPSRKKSPWFLLFYTVMVLSSAGYVAWMSVTLMDTVLWGLLIAWMTLGLLRKDTARNRLFSALPFALAPWARPEAMLVVPCGLVLSMLFRRERGQSIRYELAYGASFLASLTVLTGFRLLYFGYPLPNTFYAKVSPSFIYNVQQGAEYLLGYLRSGVFPHLAAICFLFNIVQQIVRVFDNRANRNDTFSDSRFLWLWSLILVLPPVFSGGDHFGYYRFFQPVWPFFCVLLVSTGASIPCPKWARAFRINRVRIAVLFAFVLFSFLYNGGQWGRNPRWTAISPIRREFRISKIERKNGLTLANLFSDSPEQPTLGVISAGGISRTYPGKIVDLMGLNNTAIAHHSGDRIGIKNHAAFEPELFDELGVDIMPFAPDSFHSHALKGMLESEPFVADWRCGRLKKTESGEETPPFFFRCEFLSHLLEDGAFSFRDAYRFENGEWRAIKENSNGG